MFDSETEETPDHLYIDISVPSKFREEEQLAILKRFQEMKSPSASSKSPKAAERKSKDTDNPRKKPKTSDQIVAKDTNPRKTVNPGAIRSSQFIASVHSPAPSKSLPKSLVAKLNQDDQSEMDLPDDFDIKKGVKLLDQFVLYNEGTMRSLSDLQQIDQLEGFGYVQPPPDSEEEPTPVNFVVKAWALSFSPPAISVQSENATYSLLVPHPSYVIFFDFVVTKEMVERVHKNRRMELETFFEHVTSHFSATYELVVDRKDVLRRTYVYKTLLARFHPQYASNILLRAMIDLLKSQMKIEPEVTKPIHETEKKKEKKTEKKIEKKIEKKTEKKTEEERPGKSTEKSVAKSKESPKSKTKETKTPTSTTPSTPVSPSTTPPPVKRKRGRPPKVRPEGDRQSSNTFSEEKEDRKFYGNSGNIRGTSVRQFLVSRTSIYNAHPFSTTEDLLLPHVVPNNLSTLPPLASPLWKNDSVFKAISVWQFCNNFFPLYFNGSIRFDLIQFERDMKGSTTPLTDAIYKAVVKLLLDDLKVQENALFVRTFENIVFNDITWPEILRRCLGIFSGMATKKTPQSKSFTSEWYDKLSKREYEDLSVDTRLDILYYLIERAKESMRYLQIVSNHLDILDQISVRKGLISQEQDHLNELASIDSSLNKSETLTPTHQKSLKKQRLNIEKRLDKVQSTIRKMEADRDDRVHALCFTPNGMDRFYNRYWIFRGVLCTREAGNRNLEFLLVQNIDSRLFSEESNIAEPPEEWNIHLSGRTWSVVTSEEQLEGLISSLNVGGHRESKLYRELENHKKILVSSLRSRKRSDVRLKDSLLQALYREEEESTKKSPVAQELSELPDESAVTSRREAVVDLILEFEDNLEGNRWRENPNYNEEKRLWSGRILAASSAKDMTHELLYMLDRMEVEKNPTAWNWTSRQYEDFKIQIASTVTLPALALLIEQIYDHFGFIRPEETICTVCARGTNADRMLLCDGCCNATHTFCLRPKLAEIPEGEWFCSTCTRKKMETVTSGSNGVTSGSDGVEMKDAESASILTEEGDQLILDDLQRAMINSCHGGTNADVYSQEVLVDASTKTITETLVQTTLTVVDLS
ncbi:bromodomain adjacent to zinc finger domain protein 1A [Planoprotostelium fungivorum]|uniref:Bromodomain adjacent to zinc finger domain protein 1A n=1 Tax=Planoprotostelium fungivorum TaxID=1890364 RepID=A0A2P6MXI4_9EUKA|nr:bromodomain adjacent to zinc finger domain protein 1A [Planoprotostelium fungivorum]